MIRQLFGLLSHTERNQVFFLCALSLIGAAAEALSIGAIFPFMALLNNPDAALAHPSAVWILAQLGSLPVNRIILVSACALMVLFLLKGLFLITFYSYQSRFSCSLESRLGTSLLSAYLRGSYASRLARNSADRIRIVTGEVGRVATGVVQALITLLAEGFVILAIVTLLVIAQPFIAMVSALVVAVCAYLMQTIFRQQVDKYREQRVTTSSGMFRSVNEGLGALKEIKVLGREDFVIGKFTESSRAYAHSTYVFTTLNLLPRIVFETTAVCALLISIITATLIGFPLGDIIPVLTIFGLAALRLLPSTSRIIAGLNTLRYFGSAVTTVATDLRSAESEYGLTAPAPHGTAGTTPRSERFLSLRLEDVSYRYPGSNAYSLINIGLEFKQGDAIAVVGPSGSGKSTLVDIVLGLLTPTSGTIKINGRAVVSLRGEWRGVAGLVPQEIFLIDESVRRNVAFGLPDSEIDDANVWRALSMAQLANRVRALPLGLDTMVGERGAMLSGGERQRLGIARALYNDPDILVLDEATSALDTKTEVEFTEALQALRGSKTILLITHRTSSVAWCERLLVVKNGQIVKDGPYAEVLRTYATTLSMNDRKSI